MASAYTLRIFLNTNSTLEPGPNVRQLYQLQKRGARELPYAVTATDHQTDPSGNHDPDPAAAPTAS